jgi:hypothetical protein
MLGAVVELSIRVPLILNALKMPIIHHETPADQPYIPHQSITSVDLKSTHVSEPLFTQATILVAFIATHQAHPISLQSAAKVFLISDPKALYHPPSH